MSVTTRRALLVVAGLAATGAIAVGGCRDQKQRASGEVALTPGAVVRTNLSSFAVVQDKLWVTTERGIAVIDPVDETFSMLDLGTGNIPEARIVPCGSDVWLLLRDSILLVNLKTKAVQRRGVPQPLPSPRSISASCGTGGLWLYTDRDGSLFRVSTSDTGTERHETRRPGRSRYFEVVYALQNSVYLLATRGARYYEEEDTADPEQDSANAPPETGLFRFDPKTGALDRVELPGGAQAVGLERVDDGLLVRTGPSSAVLLQVDGQPWTQVPQGKIRTWIFDGQQVLAQGSGVVWVGASYDVSPASYFVLRYIHDAMEPKDLVILARDWTGYDALRTLQYLGMLWTLSGTRLLRIDPNAEELVTYELTDNGKLKKQAFSLTKDAGALRYFDGDSLVRFHERPTERPTESPQALPDTTTL